MAPKAKPTKWTITGGPRKWDLMLSLFDHLGLEDDNRRNPEFSFQLLDQPERTTKVNITSVERTDATGHQWIFEGYADELGRIKGSYNTQFQNGVFNLWEHYQP